MRIFLDTTVLVDAIRGQGTAERLRALLRRNVQPFVCAINVEELWRGARGTAAERKLADVLLGLYVVPLGAEEGELAGRWRREFAAKGRALSQGDCLIAAAAVRIDAPLATANVKDFPMKELIVEDWTA